MALVPCPECGHSVSDQARACPECGHPLGGDAEAHSQPAEAETGSFEASIAAVKGTLLSTGKIAAIKRLRELRPGLGLAEAKTAVEKIEQHLTPAEREHLRHRVSGPGCLLLLGVLGALVVAIVLWLRAS